MLARIFAVAAVVALSAQLAHADTMDDCRQNRWPDLKLKACTAVIDDKATTGQDRVVALTQRGMARVRAGAVAQAIADFSAALQVTSDNVAALRGRAEARLTAGDIGGAIADLNAGIALRPGAVDMFLMRGHAELANGSTDAAIVDFTEAARLDPKSAAALNNRGLAYRKKGDVQKAEADYLAAIALNPLYAQAYANRGYLLEQAGRRAEAIEALKAALLADASLSGAREALARLGVADAVAAESARRIAAGQTLVEANCARCHATGKEGASPNAKAPEFRSLKHRHPLLALREPLARGIAAQHDEMPRFAVTTADVDAIVAYINSL